MGVVAEPRRTVHEPRRRARLAMGIVAELRRTIHELRRRARLAMGIVAELRRTIHGPRRRVRLAMGIVAELRRTAGVSRLGAEGAAYRRNGDNTNISARLGFGWNLCPWRCSFQGPGMLRTNIGVHSEHGCSCVLGNIDHQLPYGVAFPRYAACQVTRRRSCVHPMS